MKKIKQDTNIWKDILCSWVGKINIVEMSIQPKVIYNSYQFSVAFLKTLFSPPHSESTIEYVTLTQNQFLDYNKK